MWLRFSYCGVSGVYRFMGFFMFFVFVFTVSGGELRICSGLSLDIGECCFFEKLAFFELIEKLMRIDLN